MPAPLTEINASWSDPISIAADGEIWRVEGGAIRLKRSTDAAEDGGLVMFTNDSFDVPGGISVQVKLHYRNAAKVARF